MVTHKTCMMYACIYACGFHLLFIYMYLYSLANHAPTIKNRKGLAATCTWSCVSAKILAAPIRLQYCDTLSSGIGSVVLCKPLCNYAYYKSIATVVMFIQVLTINYLTRKTE